MKPDWRAYYKEFSLIHEDEPVLYSRDRYAEPRHKFLLFRDGWMYAASDPSGPEYPPPEDKKHHLRLIKIYWLMRERIVKSEFEKLKNQIQGFITTQQRHSAPIQVSSFLLTENDEGKIRKIKEVGPLDFELLLEKARDLHNDLTSCREELNTIKLTEPTEITHFTNISPAAILSQLEEIENDE